MSLEKIIDLDRLSRFKGKVDDQLDEKVDKPYEIKVYDENGSYTVTKAPSSVAELIKLLNNPVSGLVLNLYDTDVTEFYSDKFIWQALNNGYAIAVLFYRFEASATDSGNGTIKANGGYIKMHALVAVLGDSYSLQWSYVGSDVLNLSSSEDLSNKVDKETGKGLSTNDFTNSYKEKVDNCVAELDSNVDALLDSFELDYTSETTSINWWVGGNY